MSISPLNSVASALTQLDQLKSQSAQSALKTLVASPTAAPTTSSPKLPVDTVSLNSTKPATSGDVDHDGDSH